MNSQSQANKIFDCFVVDSCIQYCFSRWIIVLYLFRMVKKWCQTFPELQNILTSYFSDPMRLSNFYFSIFFIIKLLGNLEIFSNLLKTLKKFASNDFRMFNCIAKINFLRKTIKNVSLKKARDWNETSLKKLKRSPIHCVGKSLQLHLIHRLLLLDCFNCLLIVWVVSQYNRCYKQQEKNQVHNTMKKTVVFHGFFMHTCLGRRSLCGIFLHRDGTAHHGSCDSRSD